MPDDTADIRPGAVGLPTPPPRLLSLAESLGDSAMPASLRLYLDEALYERTKQLARIMADAEGFTPKHLIGKTAACFVVISCSLNWKLDPHFVARATYQTPGGSIGFMGTLVQAILEQSGRLVGGIEYEWTGDWNRVLGKYKIVQGSTGRGSYPSPTWTPQDAVGLGIIVRARLRNEPKPRVWPGEGQPFQLSQCFPLNSPLWATDPKTQIGYLAVRRFANQAAPALLGGMPFDEDELLDASERARDVTPHQHHPAMAAEPEPEPPSWQVFDHVGEPYTFENIDRAVEACRKILITAAADPQALATAWDNNIHFLHDLSSERPDDAAALKRLHAELAPREPRSEPETPSKGASPAPAGEANPPSTASPAPDIADETAQPDATGAQDEQNPPPVPLPEVEPVAMTAELHDRWWDSQSLRIDPPPVRGGGSLSKLDWKVWPAMVQPRIRQAWSAPTLNALYQDNADNMDKYAAACGEPAREELLAAFDVARDRFTG
jgi:hypothetical protein